MLSTNMNYSHRKVRVYKLPFGEIVVSVRLATLPYLEQCWFASDITAICSVRLRLYSIVMPVGVAVKVCAAQPATDTAAMNAKRSFIRQFPIFAISAKKN